MAFVLGFHNQLVHLRLLISRGRILLCDGLICSITKVSFFPTFLNYIWFPGLHADTNVTKVNSIRHCNFGLNRYSLVSQKRNYPKAYDIRCLSQTNKHIDHVFIGYFLDFTLMY